jgi:uncharacterized membrane protein YfcA
MWHWTDLPDLLAVLQGAGAGAIAGFVSGLLGVSPGGILVPAVCMTLGLDQHVAQGVSLVAQVPPTGLGGVSEYRRRGQAIPLKWVVLLALGFIVGGAFGAGVAGRLSDQVLRWSFVGYLLVLAALAVLSVLRRRNHSADASEERAARPHGLALLAVGFVAGLSSGALGIGGGLAVTALSTTMLHLGQHRAQAMSLILTLLPLTIPAAYVYLARGWMLPWFPVAGVILGLWIATAIGARVAIRLPERMLRPTFIVLIIAMAAYMATRSVS